MRSRSVQLETVNSQVGDISVLLYKTFPNVFQTPPVPDSRVVTVTISQLNSTLNFYTPKKKAAGTSRVCSQQMKRKYMFPYKAKKGGVQPLVFKAVGCR